MPERFKPIRFSRAGIRGLKASSTLAINDRVRERWDAGEEVYHLAFGESRWPVHPKIAEALAANAQKRSYLPARGIPPLRRAIAEHYGRRFGMDVHPDQVVVGPGSKSLIFAGLLALGEEVIMPQPSWVSYGPQSHLLGKPITMVPTRPATGFAIELDVLEEKIQESRQNWGNPEVLIVNTPGNPTGTMLKREDLDALGAFARAHDLMVLSDEIYALTVHGQVPHASISTAYPEGTVVLGGLSKSLPLGGWRFGVAIVPRVNGGRALGQAIENIASNIWTCVTAPVQYAALVAYSGDPDVEEYIDLCARLHAIRTRVLYDLMVRLGVPCVEPTGGFYIYPCFGKWREQLAARGVHNDAELAFHLLDHYQLATLPGSDFNSAQDFCLRISSSYVDAATDEKAERLLASYHDDPDPERFIANHHPRLAKIIERFGEFVTDLTKA